MDERYLRMVGLKLGAVRAWRRDRCSSFVAPKSYGRFEYSGPSQDAPTTTLCLVGLMLCCNVIGKGRVAGRWTGIGRERENPGRHNGEKGRASGYFFFFFFAPPQWGGLDLDSRSGYFGGGASAHRPLLSYCSRWPSYDRYHFCGPSQKRKSRCTRKSPSAASPLGTRWQQAGTRAGVCGERASCAAADMTETFPTPGRFLIPNFPL